jgi:hypothetical protein
MTDTLSLPPQRDLPPGRLALRAEHLHDELLRTPGRASISRRPRRIAIGVALAATVAIPATAFAGRLGDLLGISNDGTPVSTSSILPGETKLDAALSQLKLGGTMQSLGTLNGIRFYATRNADGDFCFAMVRVDGQLGKGLGCVQRGHSFPSQAVQALTFPDSTRLQGLAADGVATVQALDSSGDVLDSTPVVSNLFASTVDLPAGAVASIRTLDASGNVTSTEQLPRTAQPANKAARPGQPTNR